MAFKRGVVIEVDPADRDWFREFSFRLAIRRPDLRARHGTSGASAPSAFAELVKIAKEWEREHA